MNVLIIGGTGTLGRPTVRALRSGGATVRILSRRAPRDGTDPAWARGDVTMGEGLHAALRGVDVVVHAAHDPARPARDLAGLRHVIDAARAARVERLVFVSIVGAPNLPGVGLYRTKTRGEQLVSGAALHGTSFRASQFFELIAGALTHVDRLPVLPVPARALLQPVSADEAAVALANHVLRGGPDTLVGPEVLNLRDMIDAWQAARGRTRRIIGFSVPHPALRALASGALTSTSAPRGVLRWSEWLSRQA